VTAKGERKMEKGDTHLPGRKKRRGWPGEKKRGKGRNKPERLAEVAPVATSVLLSSQKDGHGNSIKDRVGSMSRKKQRNE
jgi:hypothetical protein